MPSIKFDNTEILNTTYIPRYIKHESIPERIPELLDLTGEEGSILVSEKYGTKRIVLVGYLTADTQAGLETAIDVFKELFSRKEKNLDISWENGTRRYVATCIRHDFDRDHFHLLFVPWTAEFVVPKGIGEDIVEIKVVDNQSFTATSYNSVVAFLGSANPKPRIRVKCGEVATDPKGLSIKNIDTGETIIATRAEGFGANEYFEIDCRLKTVTYDEDEIAFLKTFLGFKIGDNNYEIKIGKILDQEFTSEGESTSWIIMGEFWKAQSFRVPYSNDTYQCISLLLKKLNNPTEDLIVEIQTDIDGAPSGSAVTNATFTISPGDVTASWEWITKYSTNPFTLNANTTYWIVLKTAEVADSNQYHWYTVIEADALYKRGNSAASGDSGVSWTNYSYDSCFRLYYAGKEDAAKTYYFDIYYFKRFL